MQKRLPIAGECSCNCRESREVSVPYSEFSHVAIRINVFDHCFDSRRTGIRAGRWDGVWRRKDLLLRVSRVSSHIPDKWAASSSGLICLK